MSDVLFIPQNETQFQRYVRLLHRSLAKNFKMQVSLKSRSDKFNNFAAAAVNKMRFNDFQEEKDCRPPIQADEVKK